MGILGSLISRPAQDQQIVALHRHAAVMTGFPLGPSGIHQPGETPVYKIPGKMQLQAVSLIVGKIEPAGVHSPDGGHAVGGLAADQPIKAGRFVVENVVFHLAAGQG